MQFRTPHIVSHALPVVVFIAALVLIIGVVAGIIEPVEPR
ncbi:hypothetical protein GGQ99_004760 [Aminobacter niigataensis]|uniref:Uncharacterized protein n=1 Tax=Aminobacter niigataensis TaxID=83265 RepID=A0ABR6L845_9HYPH|nr:hypothetical protein [Aminobacter niigataensis]